MKVSTAHAEVRVVEAEEGTRVEVVPRSGAEGVVVTVTADGELAVRRPSDPAAD
jgi:hypothetical protein